VTATRSMTPTPTRTPSPTITLSPTRTPTRTATLSPSPTATFTASPTPLPASAGDADCNGAVNVADLPALVTKIFDPSAHNQCNGADANGDELTSAADLTASVEILASPTP